jgi:hypothetical protein
MRSPTHHKDIDQWDNYQIPITNNQIMTKILKQG